MRKLITLVLVAAALWAGWWVTGSRGLVWGVEQWIAQERALGVEVSQEGLAVQGFPNRFDLTVTAPRIRDGRSGWGWQADWLQSLMMSWKPWHVILVAPPEWQVLTPQGPVAVAAEDTRASLVLVPGAALAVDRAVAVLTEPRVQLAGGLLSAETVSLGLRRLPGAEPVQELGVEATGLAAPALQGSGHLKLDAALTLTGPLALRVEAPVGLQAVDLREARLDWGGTVVTASGKLVADQWGQAEGRIEVAVTGSGAVLDLLRAGGIVVAPMVAALVGRMEAAAGPGKPLVLPVVFGGGQTRIGPLPVGPAPWLR